MSYEITARIWWPFSCHQLSNHRVAGMRAQRSGDQQLRSRCGLLLHLLPYVKMLGVGEGLQVARDLLLYVGLMHVLAGVRDRGVINILHCE